MSSSVTGDPSAAEAYRASLTALVRDFEQDVNAYRQRIRDLVDADRGLFYAAAIELLKASDDSRGLQYVITLLVSYDLFLRALCEPALTREQSIVLARAALRVDPMTDVALAKQLADQSTSLESALSPKDAARVMDILSQISEGSRILPSLTRMLRHSNPYLRSKAVKMVGRGSGNVKWVRSRLAEFDPRVRANAVEALWGSDSEEARELLAKVACDENNRVAGNALIALYRLGDCAVIPDVVRMGDHASPLFRSSAAWVMGESGDPRFAESLAHMLRDPEAVVRGRALAALGRLKKAVARSRLLPQWLASGQLLDSASQNLECRLHLTLATKAGGEFPKILPTQVLLTEDGRPTHRYQVRELPNPETLAVIFVFPRETEPSACPWTAGVLPCLGWKRQSDLWTVQSYLAQSSPEEGPEDQLHAPVRYAANPESLEAALQTTARRSDCADLWRTVAQTLRADQAPGRGHRHLILFCNAKLERPASEALTAAVKTCRASVQVIANSPNPWLEDFCSRTSGSFRIAGTTETIADAVTLAYLKLLPHYEITYQRIAPGARALKVRVNGSDGWAETQLALPVS